MKAQGIGAATDALFDAVVVCSSNVWKRFETSSMRLEADATAAFITLLRESPDPLMRSSRLSVVWLMSVRKSRAVLSSFSSADEKAPSMLPTRSLDVLPSLFASISAASLIAICRRAAESVMRAALSLFCCSRAVSTSEAVSPIRMVAPAVRSSIEFRMRLAVSSTRWVTSPACSSGG